MMIRLCHQDFAGWPQGGSLYSTLVASVLADDLRCWSGAEGGGSAEDVPMTQSRDGTSFSLAQYRWLKLARSSW